MGSREYFGDRKALIDERRGGCKRHCCSAVERPSLAKTKVFLEREFPGA